MAHTVHDKAKLIARLKRIRGQVEGIERALAEERDCGAILHGIAACRGALNSLMAEVLEGHVREHVRDPSDRSATRSRAVEDLIGVLRTYLR